MSRSLLGDGRYQRVYLIYPAYDHVPEGIRVLFLVRILNTTEIPRGHITKTGNTVLAELCPALEILREGQIPILFSV